MFYYEILFILIICILALVATNDKGDAFCRSEIYPETRFPLEVPMRHIPWIWDANLSPDGSLVEATSISRNACKFNRTRWKIGAKMFPQYAEQFGGGLDSSILVPFDGDYDFARGRTSYKGLMGSKLTCLFIFRDEVVARVMSHEIRDEEAAEISTLQIRCHVPMVNSRRIIWTHIRLERPNEHSEVLIDTVRENVTDAFPVCNLREIYNRTNLSVKKYKLSICTATMRHDRSYLVEWLEFHRLMGVQHFFIYDTSPRKKQHLLRKVLADYVASGNITIVSWPYSNCVEGMGSGRWVQWVENKASVFFQPPRTISHTAALASCYSRFKFTTEWMAHVDDDEFLSFNFGKYFWGRRMTSLYDLVSTISSKRPQTKAVYFKPIIIMDCPTLFQFNRVVRGRVSEVLPRFGRWQAARLGPEWEGKLIMRTDAVGMFFVHYITLRERMLRQSKGDGRRIRDPDLDPAPYSLPVDAAAMLHYKTVPEVSGSIYGAYLPINLGGTPKECYIRNDPLSLNGTIYRRKMTVAILPYLEREYQNRLGLKAR